MHKEEGEKLGYVWNGRMHLNNLGRAVEDCWRSIPDHFPHLLLDEFIIMPDHLHGIIHKLSRLEYINLTKAPGVPEILPSISSAIRGFKIGVRLWCKQNNEDLDWQTSFYDNILRNQFHLKVARQYIRNNPRNYQKSKRI